MESSPPASSSATDTAFGSAGAGPFPHEWYVRVRASWRDAAPSTPNSQLPEIEQRVTALHDSLKTQSKLEAFQLLPQRFMDDSDARTEKAYTCYWLIGLPNLPPAAITEVRKITRAWEVDLDQWEGAKKAMQAKFMKQKVIVEQGLKFDVPAKDVSASDAKKNPKTQTIKTGESFRKIKGSNPAQVRKQFMQHAIGVDASGSFKKDAASGGKLRSPKDVLSRLRYGGERKMDEYVVGYIDRQAGILEKPVGEWQEYEEHELIAYFKHVPDDLIVWDRARKIDRVFNAS